MSTADIYMKKLLRSLTLSLEVWIHWSKAEANGVTARGLRTTAEDQGLLG